MMTSIQYTAQSAWRPTLPTRSSVGSYTDTASAPYARKLSSLVSTVDIEFSDDPSSDEHEHVELPIVATVPPRHPCVNFVYCPPPTAGSQPVRRIVSPRIPPPPASSVVASTVVSSSTAKGRRKKRPARVRNAPSSTGHVRAGHASNTRSSISIVERGPRSARSSYTSSVIERKPKKSTTSSRKSKDVEVLEYDLPNSTKLLVTAKKTSPVLKTCVTCLSDDLPATRTAKLECGHRMCHPCLKRVFTLSTTDPQLMPPRCCNNDDPDAHIPLRHVDRLFDVRFKRLWNRKYAEYHTKDRLYCPTKDCATWIKPKYIKVDKETGRRMGTCKNCHHKICKKCGCKWHGKRSCARDDTTKQVIEMGKSEGWQRCYSCRTMVQLAEGCNHMRCHCNAEFCYVCGCKWKTCDCPWFDIPEEILGSDVGLREAAGRRTRNLWDASRYLITEEDEGEVIVQDVPESLADPKMVQSMELSSARDLTQRRAKGPMARLIEIDASDRDTESTTDKDSNADVFDSMIAHQLNEEEEFLAATAGLGVAALSLLDPSPSSSGRSSPRDRRTRRQRHWLTNRDDRTDTDHLVQDRLDDLPTQAINDEWVTRLRPVQIGESLHGTDVVANVRSAKARRKAGVEGSGRRIHTTN